MCLVVYNIRVRKKGLNFDNYPCVFGFGVLDVPSKAFEGVRCRT